MLKPTPSAQIDWQTALSSIPADWVLTPVRAKRPLRDAWQTEAKIPRQELLRLLKEGQWLNKRSPKPGEATEWHCRWDGIGLRTGEISGGIVALDQDGPSAIPKILELSGGEELPKTVAFSSGREGRSQYLFRVPEEYWSAIETKKYKTAVKGDDGEIEQVELRWNGCQSVIPPSAHPLTEGYHYLPECAPWECEIAVAPQWLIERMLCESSNPEPTPQTSQPKRHSTSSTYQTNDHWTDEQWAVSYLDALSSSRADDYDDWLAAGMALHSINESLLPEWDKWSQQSSKYKSGDCEKKWKSFNSSGVSIGSLAHMAKLDGWSSPFQKKEKSPQQQEPKPKFHPKTIEELKKLDLVTAIGEHIKLEKRGKDFVGLCPFHDEVIPSFSVSPNTNLYNCFGCSDSGNILKFFTKLGAGKYSFSDVVLDLSRRYQIEALSGDGTKIPLPESPLTFPKRNSSGGNQKSGSNSSTAEASLRDRLLEIIYRENSISGRKEAYLELAKVTGHQPRAIEQLADILESEIDFDAEAVEAKVNLPDLLRNHSQEVNPSDYLWGDGGRLAAAMNATAAAMPTAVAMIFSTFIAASASRIGTSSRIVIKASAKYVQVCIFWIAVVSRSGTLKTPAQRVAIDPLTKLEVNSKQAYDKALEDYKEAQKNSKEGEETPKKPKPRKRYLTKDSTLETLERIHGDNPRGFLYYRDELAGMAKSQNAFKPSGKGADQEAELDQWNGSALIVDRGDRQICLPETAVSRTGSVQYEVLQKLAGDHEDSNGNMARWLLSAVKAPPRYFTLDDAPDTGISELLESLYKNLELLPDRDYLIDRDSQIIFKNWQNQLVDAELAENHPGLKLVYPKIEAYTARFALWLHCVNAILAGELPVPTIPGSTMQKAVALASFFLCQAKLIYAINSSQSGLTGRLLKLYQYAEGKSQGITPRQIKRNSRLLGSVTTGEILRECQMLVKDGFFRQEGEIFFAVGDVGTNVGSVGTNVGTPPTPKETVYKPSQDFVGIVGNVGTNVGTLPTPEETVYKPSQEFVGNVGIVGSPKNLNPSPMEDLLAADNSPHQPIAVGTAADNADNADKSLESTAITSIDIVGTAVGGVPTTADSADNCRQPSAATAEVKAEDVEPEVGDEWLDPFEEVFEERARKALDAENISHQPAAPAVEAGKLDAIAPQPALEEPLKVGDRVTWDNCPPHFAWGNPFQITAIRGATAELDLVEKPVPLAQLRR